MLMPAVAPIEGQRSMPPFATPGQYTSVPEVRALYWNNMVYGLESYAQSSVLQSTFMHAVKLDRISRLPPDWDGDGAEAPNDLAKLRALRILDILQRKRLDPTAILPSVEGGFGFTFVSGTRRGSIEIFNSREMVAALYDGREEPVIWEIDGSGESIVASVARICVCMSA